MCDYCGCRSMPVIDELGAEHEALLTMCGAVRRAIDAGDRTGARAAFAGLLVALRLHTEVEERSILAVMRSSPELTETVDALLAEHGAVHDAVAALDEESWDAGVRKVLDDLHDHIAREEYDVFPASLLAIDLSGWDAVEAAAAEVRGRGR